MKKENLLVCICAAVSLAGVLVWQLFFAEKVSFYMVGMVLIVLTILPFFASFERGRAAAVEISLLAVMAALAVASRAAFYALPQVKPICAVVIVSGVCFGAKNGFAVGAISAFVSNFLFGHGVWTPYQMLALGLCGLFAGLLFRAVRPTRVRLAVYGFFAATVLYGLIVDLSTVFMTLSRLTWQGVFGVYAAGAVFSLIFGATTAVFLFLFGEAFVKKINRIQKKYAV